MIGILKHPAVPVPILNIEKKKNVQKKREICETCVFGFIKFISF